MSDAGVRAICFTCGIGFTYNPEKLNTFIPRYKITVCPGCWAGNWDGWRPDYSDKIEAHLKANNLPPVQRNSEGLMPRS